MSKTVFCANCGRELAIMRKAIPSQAKVIDLVEPHECGEEVDLDESIPLSMSPDTHEKHDPAKEVQQKKRVDELFDSFDFVKKLNKVEDKKKTVFQIDDPGDRRDPEHLRKEVVTSTAPQGLLNRALLGAGKPEKSEGYNGESDGS